jgi:hypothetical protein
MVAGFRSGRGATRTRPARVWTSCRYHAAMGRAVLLLHEGGGSGTHYDWLIEGPPGGLLVSFRVSERIDTPGFAHFEAQRIADHRPEYLSYEGPVSGGRGTVRRVAEGTLAIEIDSGEHFLARGRLGRVSGAFEGQLLAGDRWRFVLVAEA